MKGATTIIILIIIIIILFFVFSGNGGDDTTPTVTPSGETSATVSPTTGTLPQTSVGAGVNTN